MKICTKCKIGKDNQLFHKNKASIDGLFSHCKECVKEYDASVRNCPNKIFCRKRWNKSAEGKSYKNLENKLYRSKKEEIIKSECRKKTNTAIRNGILIRKPCEICNTNINVECHHEDYSRPLFIKWLCVKHHKLRHNNMDLMFEDKTWHNKKLKKEIYISTL